MIHFIYLNKQSIRVPLNVAFVNPSLRRECRHVRARLLKRAVPEGATAGSGVEGNRRVEFKI